MLDCDLWSSWLKYIVIAKCWVLLQDNGTRRCLQEASQVAAKANDEVNM